MQQAEGTRDGRLKVDRELLVNAMEQKSFMPNAVARFMQEEDLEFLNSAKAINDYYGEIASPRNKNPYQLLIESQMCARHKKVIEILAKRMRHNELATVEESKTEEPVSYDLIDVPEEVNALINCGMGNIAEVEIYPEEHYE